MACSDTTHGEMPVLPSMNRDLFGSDSLWLNPKVPSLPIVASTSKEDPLPGAALARIPTF